MATIIEVQDTKLENLTEYVEKMLTYGGKLMHCLEDMKGHGIMVDWEEFI